MALKIVDKYEFQEEEGRTVDGVQIIPARHTALRQSFTLKKLSLKEDSKGKYGNLVNERTGAIMQCWCSRKSLASGPSNATRCSKPLITSTSSTTKSPPILSATSSKTPNSPSPQRQVLLRLFRGKHRKPAYHYPARAEAEKHR